MKLYNTLTRKIDTLETITEHKVNMFVCGPTVYDYSHLGHAKTYTQLDILARTLRASGYTTFYLQNITDIDDKIIARALENKVSWQELRDIYQTEYLADMASLGNNSVTQYVRATDHIDDIIRQVQTLLEKGNAYQISDGIYFEIATFPSYGKLSRRQEVQENDAQTRIDQSEEKRGWNDFCLWKFSKPGEPVWEAPFGKGRPGWHIEDTAITEHFFGPQYDIHGGAIDLIFPHHEAEITQMEAASGKEPFVRYWTHTGFLNIDNAKMSKSLKNFYTIREVLDKGYDPMNIRLFMLQSHYRSPINFSWDNLDAAGNRLRAYRAMADLRWQTHEATDTSYDFTAAYDEILVALQEDLNTPQALVVLSRVEEILATQGVGVEDEAAFETFLKKLDDLFGLGLATLTDLPEAQKLLIGTREAARKNKDWAQSDALRDELQQQGIGLRDMAHGAVWYRL
jgi:cysteinyl-tRNA synthetase